MHNNWGFNYRTPLEEELFDAQYYYWIRHYAEANKALTAMIDKYLKPEENTSGSTNYQ